MKATTLLLALASGAYGQCPSKTDSHYQWVETRHGIEIYVDLYASNDDSWIMLLLNRSGHSGIRYVVLGPNNKRVEDYAPIPPGDCASVLIGKDEKIKIR